jgi:hypothetical protein
MTMTAITEAAAAAPGRVRKVAGWTLTGLFAASMIFDVGTARSTRDHRAMTSRLSLFARWKLAKVM